MSNPISKSLRKLDRLPEKRKAVALARIGAIIERATASPRVRGVAVVLSKTVTPDEADALIMRLRSIVPQARFKRVYRDRRNTRLPE